MNRSIQQAQNLYALQQLGHSITSELNLACEVLQQSDEIPIDTLLVVLEPDAHQRDRVASLMFIPLEETEVEAVKLLQFYCDTPISVPAAMRGAVAQVCAAVNLKIPLGAFSLSDEDRVVLRYVLAVGRFATIEPAAFVETFLLWMFALDATSSLIEDVAAGRLALDDAIAQV
jgi:hypothetical protein